jgi:hypothetical protein
MMFSFAGALALTLTLATPQTPAPEAPPTPDTERDRPITQLFQNLGRDIVRLPSLESAVIAVVGGGGALAAERRDARVLAWVDRQPPSEITVIGRVGGTGLLHGSAAIATYAIGLAGGHEPTIHVGSDLIRAQLLNGVITRTLKLATQRPRPSGSKDSLPSGHASASFTTAAVLGSHYGWGVGIPAYAGASFVAWTRVRDRAHWLSDVVLGATVGTIVGRTVTKNHRARGWAIVPTAGRDGVGVMVVKVTRGGQTEN